jgi:5-methylcytosine-specific restriction enzyme A
MPSAPPKQCRHPSCPGYAVHRGFCPAHQRVVKAQYREYNQTRRDPLTMEWHNSHRYKAERDGFLRENPLCAKCFEHGACVPAAVLDHVKPHGGDPLLFWNQKNWQALCTRCHGRKRAEEKADTTLPLGDRGGESL